MPTTFEVCLLCAGKGTRLRPFTEKVPKVWLPLLGVSLFQLQVDLLESQGVSTVACNVFWKKEYFFQKLSEVELSRLVIKAHEESPLLDTGGGIAALLRFVSQERFFVCNSDVLWDFSLQELWERHLFYREREGAAGTLLLVPQRNSLYTAVLCDAKGTVLGFGEEGEAFFSGIAIYEKEVFLKDAPSGPFPLSVLWKKWIAEKKLFAFLPSMPFFWVDTGSTRLWWEAHWKVMQLLEEKRQMSFLPRILRENHSFAPFCWAQKGAVFSQKMPGPWYFGGKGKVPPLGPYAVFYGSGVVSEVFEGGIAWGGEKVFFKKSASS